MRNSNNKQHNFTIIGSFILPVCIVVCSIFFAKPFSEKCGKLSLWIAGSSVPEGSVNMIKSEFNNSSVSSVNVIGNHVTEKTDDTTKKDKKEEKVTAYNQSQTPTDISKIVEQAKAAQKDAKKSGDIQEVNYHTAGGNTKYGNVYVKNATKNNSVDIKSELSKKADLQIADKSKPTVLVFHSHTSEAYEFLDRGWFSDQFNTRSRDNNKNVVRVGTAIVQRLRAAGFVVIHDTSVHDTTYKGSYPSSRTSIEKYKKQYPTLKVIIDIHRDGMRTSENVKLKPTSKINGKKAAQVMIITGCQEGPVTDFPDWKQNLTFSVQLQHKAESLYPNLMRPIYFCRRKYNMDTSHCGVLIEVGSDSNTLEEAVYSGELIGNSLAALMNDYAS